MNEVILRNYRADPQFRKLMVEIRAERLPVIKSWKPQVTRDENEQLIEEIKFASAQQQGFDLLYRLLTGE